MICNKVRTKIKYWNRYGQLPSRATQSALQSIWWHQWLPQPGIDAKTRTWVQTKRQGHPEVRFLGRLSLVTPCTTGSLTSLVWGRGIILSDWSVSCYSVTMAILPLALSLSHCFTFKFKQFMKCDFTVPKLVYLESQSTQNRSCFIWGSPAQHTEPIIWHKD